MAKLYERQCILGVKVNGTTFILTTLNEGDDQSSYDYIVNTSNSSYNNGNGSFSITILNRDFEKGLPLNNWVLLEGIIGFDWGSSDCYFILVDENGERTNKIFASSGRGSAAGFSLENLTRSIFPKARDIIAEYPSAKIYNAIDEFNNLARKLKDFHKETARNEEKTYTAIRYYEEKALIPLKRFFETFDELHSLLSKNKDNRCVLLKDKIIQDFRKRIQDFFD